MLPEISRVTGVAITDHILLEAGDDKDAVDRDFNSCNIAFNSFVKSPGAVMLNADHIVEALEKAKGTKKGIINAAYSVHRPTDAIAKKWSDSLDTAAFAALAGCKTQAKGSKAVKSKQDIYRMQICWGGNKEFLGLKFWAHYKYGAGKFLSATQLRSVWQNALQDQKLPPISSIPMQGTSGTKLGSGVVVQEFKWQMNKVSQRKVRDEKKDLKAEKHRKEEADVDAEFEAQVAKQKLFRCVVCKKPFKLEWHLDLHCSVAG